jgi:A/G-specific adenine glycosylase
MGPPLGRIQRTLTHRELEIILISVTGRTAPRALAGYSELTWATPSEAETLGMSTAMQKALAIGLRKGVDYRSPI